MKSLMIDKLIMRKSSQLKWESYWKYWTIRRTGGDYVILMDKSVMHQSPY